MAGVLLLLLVKAWVDFLRLGYLPTPFWPDPQDVYADGYSTAWWAFNGAMYDIWKTVYPPLSFAILRLIADGRCYDADVTFVRDCDWQLWWVTLGFYAINTVIAFRTFRQVDRATAVPRTIGVMLGLPMLYSFEHLNLLVFAYTGFFLAFSPAVRSARVAWLGIAVAVNLKVYLIVVLLGQLLRRRWRWVEGALILTAAVGVVSFALVGHGTPREIYDNIVTFSQDPDRSANWYFVFYASSYMSMVEFFSSKFPLMFVVGSWRLEFFADALTLLVRGVQAATLLTFLAIWFRPEAITRTRIAALCYMLVLISNETGGYTVAGAIFLVFFERWQGRAKITALICAWLLCLAIDVQLVPIGQHVVDGYFAGRRVWQDLWLTAGPFVRPGLIIGMQLGLVAATWTDIRRRALAENRSGQLQDTTEP